jgi:hypothetical protein
MIRPRREEDLERCVALLRRVYEVDRYPMIWPPDTVRWLSGRDALAAWVAEDDGRLLGHLSLHPTEHSLRLVLDVAEHNRDAIAFYERRGWTRAGTAELALSAEPRRLSVVLFVLP